MRTMVLIFLLVSFLASTVGAICGIGGGVVIKPVLDLLQLASVEAGSFMSGVTVLCMALYSVGHGLVAGDSKVDLKSGTWLALGAAAGGVAGKQLFGFVRATAGNDALVGMAQSALLALVTLGTLIYTLKKDGIKPRSVAGAVPGLVIGFVLGMLSSFLGIGGGPINLVVLHYFFSMDTKTAAQNSLYIILFSQTASLVATLASDSVPPFAWPALLLMALGGVLGGMFGRKLNKKMSEKAVDRLFVGLMVVIIGISCFNTVRYGMQ